jgi:hypothetical protein
LSNNMLPKKSNGIELRKLLSHFCRHNIEVGMVYGHIKATARLSFINQCKCLILIYLE